MEYLTLHAIKTDGVGKSVAGWSDSLESAETQKGRFTTVLKDGEEGKAR